MLNINPTWNWNSSLFSQMDFKNSLFLKPTLELNPIANIVGGVLSVYTLSNFLDTWNRKFSNAAKLKEINLKDVYHILSLSTLIAPLASIIQSSSLFYKSYSSYLYSSLRGNSIYTLTGGSILLYNLPKTLKSTFKILSGNATTDDRINIARTATISLGTLGSIATSNAAPLPVALAAAYSTDTIKSIYNLVSRKGTADDWLKVAKTGALYAIGAGFIYNSKWILNAVSPWVQTINTLNLSAMLLFRSIDIIKGKDRYDSNFQASLSIVFTIGGFFTINGAITSAVALMAAYKISSFLGINDSYTIALHYIDRIANIGAVIYIAPQVLSSIFGLSVLSPLSSAAAFISSSGVTQFLSSIATYAASTQAGSVAASAAVYCSPLLIPAGVITIGGLALYKGYSFYKERMNLAYKDPTHVLFDSTGKREFKLTDILINSFDIIKNTRNLEFIGGYKKLPAMATVGISFGIGMYLCAVSFFVLTPYLQPLITSAAVSISSKVVAGGITGYLTNAGIIGLTGGLFGGIKGLYEGNIAQNAIKYAVYAGGAVLLSSLMLGNNVGIFAVGVLTTAAPAVLAFSIGAFVSSIIIANVFVLASQHKKPGHLIIAERLLSNITELNSELKKFPFADYPGFSVGDINKGAIYIKASKINLPADITPLELLKLGNSTNALVLVENPDTLPNMGNDNSNQPVENINIINDFMINLQKLAGVISKSDNFSENQRKQFIQATLLFTKDIEKFKKKITNYDLNDHEDKIKIKNILNILNVCEIILLSMDKIINPNKQYKEM